MTAYLWTHMILNGLGFFMYSYYMCRNDYPREKSYPAYMDFVGLISSMGFCAWANFLLFM